MNVDGMEKRYYTSKTRIHTFGNGSKSGAIDSSTKRTMATEIKPQIYKKYKNKFKK